MRWIFWAPLIESVCPVIVTYSVEVPPPEPERAERTEQYVGPLS